MAKRNSRSEADDTASATPAAPVKGRRSRPRGAQQGGRAAAAAPAPTISDTQAGRPTPEDIHPPADTIAADPTVLEANQFDERGGEPSDEEIRAHAYRLYLTRGGQHGLHEDDWYRAERELRKRK